MGGAHWRRPGATQVLSAYLDRELALGEREKLSARLVFDREAARQLAAFGQVSARVDRALEPEDIPDSSVVAARVLASPGLAGSQQRADSFGAVKAAVIASFGLALTAGLALIHLRRRGRRELV